MKTLVCQELEALHNEHRKNHGDIDPLCVFLSVHICICHRIDQEHRSTAVRKLNANFVQCFTRVYEAHARKEAIPTTCLPPANPDHHEYKTNAWGPTLTGYEATRTLTYNPAHFTQTLLNFVIIHVLQDLSCVVAQQLVSDDPITKTEFDKVNRDITECLRRINPDVQKLLPEFVLKLVNPRGLVGRTKSAIGIWNLRSFVWKHAKALAGVT